MSPLHHAFRAAPLVLAISAAVSPVAAQAPSPVGVRPYELEWAGRSQDAVAPLVGFEEAGAWTVEAKEGTAAFERSREQQIWGRWVAKLTYRGAGGKPDIRVRPAQPVAVRGGFDTVTCWVYGNNWGFSPDPKTPPVAISAVFTDSRGAELDVPLGRVNWKEWHLLHRRLTPEQRERVSGEAAFTGFRITGGTNEEDRVLYFDNLAAFTESLPPLRFAPRAQRGMSMFNGQGSGLNTGPGRLPFPTRPQTILPPNLTPRFTTRLTGDAASGFVFTYRGDDGTLTYRIRPQTGTLGDITARWAGCGGEIRPCDGGGVYLAQGDAAIAPAGADHLGTRRSGDTVISRWRLRGGNSIEQPVTYTYRLWNKTLVVDVAAPGGNVAEVRYGRAAGLESPRLVTNPYYGYAPRQRPAVAISGPATAPLFLAGNTDWYLSNASTLWSTNAVDTTAAAYNGGTRYTPRTDGRRNDCFERLFLTLTPRYEETLPAIPNPQSPWMNVMAPRLWRAHGASNRDNDRRYWERLHRYGITEMVVTDHETMWRDGGESFTFRTRTAPGKGGDEAQFAYTRFMNDTLGYVYGPYNNFTDLAPVNAFWSPDRVGRQPDGQLQSAWFRCYAPKPAFAVEACAALAPEIERKFDFRTAYCDVHTAVAPWQRVDYDARVPGAGTFAGTFYAYGEIMLLQKQAWNGPVYSEGGYHAFYTGLTDGNYAQDRTGDLADDPWLVDFDLHRLHPLSCNFGMGNPEMFFGDKIAPATAEEKEARLDRFLAATVAFGHPGFLEHGLEGSLRSYYLLQQLQSRYAIAAVDSIRYADETGRLLDTSTAVASGAYRRSQVVVRYADGTWVAVNGNAAERMAVTVGQRRLDLPPNGYCGWTEDNAIDVRSADRAENRSDYASTPAYLYVDGRGRFTRFPNAAGSGAGICRRIAPDRYEVIPVAGAECGFAVQAGSAVALDEARNPLGSAALRVSRGLTYVEPVRGAFSYVLESGAPDPRPALTAERDVVLPGERVTVRGSRVQNIVIPADAAPGQRIWRQVDGQWIDFTVAPVADASVALEGAYGRTLRVRLWSNLPTPAEFSVVVAGREQKARVVPGQPADVRIDLGDPEAVGIRPLAVDIVANPPAGMNVGAVLTHQVARRLDIASEPVTIASVAPAEWRGGMRQRRGAEQADVGDTGAAVRPQTVTAGGSSLPALFLHPPYQGGVGYAFAVSPPVAIPTTEKPAFRAVVGKGDGSDPGDGILYRLIVIDSEGVETTVAEETVARHEWHPLEADLSKWSGKTIRLKVVADVGPKDNSSGDWAAIAEARVETAEPQRIRRLLPAQR